MVASGTVKEIRTVDQMEKITKKNAGKLIVVEIFLDGCAACQRIAPVYERLAAEYKNVVFLKVNSKGNGTCSERHVLLMPMLKWKLT
ncbi:thioredoxin [Opisthorchis viverrini]|uniref:Thioredoxin n=1 Tax=Opisthorchis viverrini TaxID=6198 RepID=A0A1S8X8B9_OPIVI|nr:thioredoxin [Opisthorchis viverrini]